MNAPNFTDPNEHALAREIQRLDAEARRAIRAMGWSVSDASEAGSGFPRPELLSHLIDAR